MRVRPALWSFAIQAAGSAATVGAALLVASTLGLGAQGQFGLLRSWTDALTSAAVLGLPQSLLHLQYREQVPIAALRDWVVRYVIALAASLAVLALIVAWWWPDWASMRFDKTTLLVLAAVVPLAAAHLLARSLVLRGVGVVPYALITALPSLLIVVALLPICLAGGSTGFVWALLLSAALSAAASVALVRSATRDSAPGSSSAPWSRRTLWSIGLETGAQNVLTASSPALMLSTASLLGAPLADVGLVSLGLHVYQLFGVAAAYAAPQLYDRAARADRHIGSRELLAAVRSRLDARAGISAALASGVVVVLAMRFWPPGAASPWLLAVMALAGAVSMWSRLLVTLMLARGAFRPLSVQAFARLVCACGFTAVLMQHWSASTAVPVALLATELLMLGWLTRAMRELAGPGGSAPIGKPGLVVITTNYPFTYTGGETMFVAPEMERLAREFGSLTVAPQHTEGNRLAVPAGVAVELGLAERLQRERVASYFAALLDRRNWPELVRGLRRGGAIGLVRVWRWAAVAHVTTRWARTAFAADGPRLFYTYWRGGSTLALARLAAERGARGNRGFRGARDACAVVTRVHRYELYENAFTPPFQPWHPEMYASLALTAPISRHGLDYLRAVGVQEQRMALYRLGTEPLSRAAGASSDGVSRVVSCSHMSSVKRVPLMAESLLLLARRRPTRQFQWTHFGDGAEMARVRALLAVTPPNLAATLRGHVANEFVRQHYAQTPVDVFLLLSESEGLPVSIQEAASAGVPVVATDVGGVGELVGEDNGALLPPDCSAEAAADALERVLLDTDAARCAARRAASLRRWREGFDAEVNHTSFARRLHEMSNALIDFTNDAKTDAEADAKTDVTTAVATEASTDSTSDRQPHSAA